MCLNLIFPRGVSLKIIGGKHLYFFAGLQLIKFA